MSAPHMTVEDDPDPADLDSVRDSLYEYNIAATGYDDFQPLAVFLRDVDGGILGGLTGYTWGGCLRIEFVWLPEDQRGQGHGARLLAAAERAGRARGCRTAVLDSHSFQAPEFYQRQGYAVIGVAEDTPVGQRQVYLHKWLT